MDSMWIAVNLVYLYCLEHILSMLVTKAILGNERSENTDQDQFFQI